MAIFYSVIGFLIAISVLVAVHEFGHFWVARKLGVKVLRYSIGFGRPLWKKTAGVDQTEYVVAAIPLGGYVKMLGEGSQAEPVDPAERHRAFDNQPIWKRSLIVAAGPGINFLFAILLFMLVGLSTQQSLVPILGEVPPESTIAQAGVKPGDRLVSIDGRPVNYFAQHDLYIFNQVLRGQDIRLEVQQADTRIKQVMVPVGDIPIYNINPSFLARTLGLIPIAPEVTTELSRILPGSRAEEAGLQAGDKIVRIDNLPIDSWQELVEAVSAAAERELQLTVQRDDLLLQIAATPERQEIQGQATGRLGIGPVFLPWAEEHQVVIQRNLWQAAQHGVEQTWLMSWVTLRMLWKMVTLQVSHQNISGPITIAQVSGQAIQVSLDYYLSILAVISISLGVMNLLPIPILDGGHLLMYAVEAIAGQNVAAKVFEVGQRLGVLLLIGLMSLAFYNDIFRLLN